MCTYLATVGQVFHVPYVLLMSLPEKLSFGLASTVLATSNPGRMSNKAHVWAGATHPERVTAANLRKILPQKRERERAFDVHFRDNIIGILKASWRMVAMLGSRRPVSSCTATCVICGVTILTTWSYKVAGQLADTMGGNCFDCNVISRGDSSSKAIVICSRAAMCW